MKLTVDVIEDGSSRLKIPHIEGFVASGDGDGRGLPENPHEGRHDLPSFSNALRIDRRE